MEEIKWMNKDEKSNSRFQQCLESLTEKWMDIEDRDFFKYVPYELTYEEFIKELEEHDYHSWIPIHCKIREISEDAFKIILWERYTGKSIWETRFKKT